MSAGHERRHLLMPYLNVFYLVTGSIDRPDNPVDPVAGIAIDSSEAPFGNSFNEKIANRLAHMDN
jgi:hypothetical protein